MPSRACTARMSRTMSSERRTVTTVVLGYFAVGLGVMDRILCHTTTTVKSTKLLEPLKQRPCPAALRSRVHSDVASRGRAGQPATRKAIRTCASSASARRRSCSVSSRCRRSASSRARICSSGDVRGCLMASPETNGRADRESRAIAAAGRPASPTPGTDSSRSAGLDATTQSRPRSPRTRA
jgi:hypothetical protein